MQQNTSVDSSISSSVQNLPRLNIGLSKSLLFEDQAAPLPHVVPRYFDGKGPIQQDVMHNFSCARLVRPNVDIADALLHEISIVLSIDLGERAMLTQERSLATDLRIRYKPRMPKPAEHIDKPEPRWQAVLAFLAICTIYLALPRNLVVGPIWLLPTLIVVLLVPTVVSHRMGKHSLNRALGVIINGITTLALIGSVILLVRALPSHRGTPLQLLRSGGLLWLTNVIVFALWYWRLDGGGPTLRHKQNKFGSTSFLFPQMQVPHDERAQFECTRWRPRFIDYLFVAFTQSSTFGPTDAPLLARWAKVLAMIQIFISLGIVVLLISGAVGAL